MTVALIAAVGFLLMLCALLVFLVIGRDRAATKQENADRRYIADLERQLHAATSALLTDLNSLPTTEDQL